MNKVIFIYKLIFLFLTFNIITQNVYASNYKSVQIEHKNLTSIKNAIPIAEPLSKGCNRPYKIKGKKYVPDISDNPYKNIGMASWYGPKFHGRKTSNGEIYDMYAMTAAHKTLPIPCYVKVTNINNNKHIIVRINDRGPFYKDRIIDLSYTAAYKLDLIEKGVGKVLIEKINTKNCNLQQNNKSIKNNLYFLQIGAFKMKENAINCKMQLETKLKNLSSKNINVENSDQCFRVKIGPYNDKEIAISDMNNIKNQLGISTHILKE
ncbi:Endolytic peptidoglycan transglycosylase RlpA [Candidatus Kinetoplastibacterium sorsogonicusi]|uniref:Endolytic peptidoglycan transglycosylase RlpA n=1 Tax=Candidatus Kinetoplastidibacterium kentomonadis TaxID=1576550 RepID=A0A3S7JAM6_9PROT|nr:septal ring lytic transglycosylase RlpA family protein [Candidatus Kinetoplastibacterium sorsogonicusi]AWD32728.1 Endolytic peptidoglycan transglycosylase RlpA [Candidatus Kinetoplastibacterium sorsogonicusi]